jgi:hypothetical protein
MYQIIFRRHDTPESVWLLWTVDPFYATEDECQTRLKNLRKSYKHTSFALLQKL